MTNQLYILPAQTFKYKLYLFYKDYKQPEATSCSPWAIPWLIFSANWSSVFRAGGNQSTGRKPATFGTFRNCHNPTHIHNNLTWANLISQW